MCCVLAFSGDRRQRDGATPLGQEREGRVPRHRRIRRRRQRSTAVHLGGCFPKGSQASRLFSKIYPAARAYRESVFNYFYESVTDAYPDVLVWMEAHHYKLWMRSSFNPEIKWEQRRRRPAKPGCQAAFGETAPEVDCS